MLCDFQEKCHFLRELLSVLGSEKMFSRYLKEILWSSKYTSDTSEVDGAVGSPGHAVSMSFLTLDGHYECVCFITIP